jgi:glutamate formiminotransferase
MLECVPNVAEGRDTRVIDELTRACGTALLDVHVDPDHHRTVLTLAGPDTEDAARALALAVAARLDVSQHAGVHPRIGALDVVPFVALGGSSRAAAADAAIAFGAWIGDELALPVYLYGDADPARRPLPEARRAARAGRAPEYGPRAPHPRLGAVAVGARPVLVAVNCELASDDLELARAIAREVRERDGGLPGVRALGLRLASRGSVQVSMNLVDLERTGLQAACRTVHAAARAHGAEVTHVELVGLLPAAELARCDAAFLAATGIDDGRTIEARLRRAR